MVCGFRNTRRGCENEIEILILHGVDKRCCPRIAQIKEKMAGLRFYVRGSILPHLRCQILQAEADEVESCLFCERCGAEGILRDGSWRRTYCDNCCAEEEAKPRQ